VLANFNHYAVGVGNLTITPVAFSNSTITPEVLANFNHYAGGVG
jgi:hypothetical protein